MENPKNSNKACLATLPVEIIREIANCVETPEDLLRFACICKDIYSCIGIVDVVRNDARYQDSLDVETLSGMVSAGHFREEKVCMLRTVCHVTVRTTEPIYVHKPCLLQAIEKGFDVGVIRRYIQASRAVFPEGIIGMWYPGRQNIRGGQYKAMFWVLEEFPSPMFAAAREGRLDVVKVLAEEFGVDVRGRDQPGDFKSVGKSDTWEMENILNDDMFVVDDAFAAACQSKHEDIAQYMISHGLRVRTGDLLWAIRSGCLQVMKTLLNHTFFKGNLGAARILLMLDMVLHYYDTFLVNNQICTLLLNAIVDEDTAPLFSHSRYLSRRVRDAIERRKNVEGVFALWVKFVAPPLAASTVIALEAAAAGCLTPVKTILSNPSWMAGNSDPERLRFQESMKAAAISSLNCDIIEYLLSIGYQFSAADLLKVIEGEALDVFELLLASGTPTTDPDMEQSGPNPLEKAITTPLNPVKCCMAFRLLYHGADPSSVSGLNKYLFGSMICSQDKIWRLIRTHLVRKRFAKSPAKIPSRMIFSKTFESPTSEMLCRSPQFSEQFHALTVLVLGSNYDKELKWRLERHEDFERYQIDCLKKEQQGSESLTKIPADKNSMAIASCSRDMANYNLRLRVLGR
ncbi:hypothetical protein M426DRAFT_15794 [Hypoxylon sp. CI-4A]|nr:hypothetical protein M426DRAFT_15794 [Hypoxylon sp. CI-4A]